MLLRVYAMWSRSRLILGVLLLVYIPTAIVQLVNAIMFVNPDTYHTGMSCD